MDTSGGRAVSIESHESWSEEGEIEASLGSKEICKSMLSAGHLVAIDLDPEPSPGDNEQVERSRMDIEVGEEDSSFRYSISSMETQSSLDTSSELTEHSNDLEEVSTEPFHIVGSTGAISHVKSRSNPKRKLRTTNGQVTEDVADEGGRDVVEIASAPAGRMGKVELEEYANDPSLVRIRWCLLILCCFVWLAILIAAIAIIVSAPKYRVPAPLEYWQESPVYQVIPQTFRKSESDKFDLQGIISGLGHFVELGIKTIVLSSIFKSNSPSSDGHLITDFKSVDPELGSLEDFETLIKAANASDLKIVLDVTLNHCSDEHEWFKRSVNKTAPYTDYFVWRNCTEVKPPNNWLSITGESAWTYNKDRNQCYLHQSGKRSPDFNFHSSDVRQALIHDALAFWLELGVAGFRIQGVQHLYEDDEYKDEPFIKSGSGYGSLNHTYTVNQVKNLNLLAKIRKLLDASQLADGKRRILMTDVDESVASVVKYYGSKDRKIVDIPLNYELVKDLKEKINGTELGETIEEVLKTVPKWSWPNWVLSNSKTSRLANRFGSLADALTLVQMTLPGTPVIYYGDEVGMQDSNGSTLSQYLGPACGEMDWESVESQKHVNGSRFNVFKSLGELRKSQTFRYGDVNLIKDDESILAFTRSYRDSPSYLILVNVSNRTITADFKNQTRLADELEVKIRTAESSSSFDFNLNKANVTVGPFEGLVLSFSPEIV